MKFFDLALGIILKLCFDQSLYRVTNTDHSFDAVLARHGSLNGVHHAVLSVVNLSVHNRKGKVLHGRIGGDFGPVRVVLVEDDFAGVEGAARRTVEGAALDVTPAAWSEARVENRFRKKLSEIFVFIGLTGGFGAIGSRAHHHFTEYHIGIVDKVLVHSDAVLIDTEVYPILLSLYDSVSFLEKNNIRHNLVRSCAIKGIVGQTDSTEEVGSLRDILSDRRVLFIKSTRTGNECNDTTGANLIQGFRKEIVVNKEVVLVVLLIKELEIIERYITDCHVKEAIGKMSFLISVDGNAVLLIELPCNSTRNAVKLNTIHLGVHTLGKKSHKVTYTARGFKNVTTFKSHIFKSVIHRPNNRGRRVKSRQRRFVGGFVFFRRKQIFQFVVLHAPIILGAVKRIGKTAPSRILCKYLLLLGCCQAIFCFKLIQKLDGINVLSELGFCSTHSDLVVGNTVIVLLAVGYLGV